MAVQCGIREAPDDEYLLACRLLGVQPWETDKRDNVFVLWHRASTVNWAKRVRVMCAFQSQRDKCQTAQP